MWMERRIAPVSLRSGPSMVPKSGGPVGTDRVKVIIATTSERRVVRCLVGDSECHKDMDAVEPGR